MINRPFRKEEKENIKKILIEIIIHINESPHRYMLYDVFKRYVEPQFRKKALNIKNRHEHTMQRPRNPKCRLMENIPFSYDDIEFNWGSYAEMESFVKAKQNKKPKKE